MLDKKCEFCSEKIQKEKQISKHILKYINICGVTEKRLRLRGFIKKLLKTLILRYITLLRICSIFKCSSYFSRAVDSLSDCSTAGQQQILRHY